MKNNDKREPVWREARVRFSKITQFDRSQFAEIDDTQIFLPLQGAQFQKFVRLSIYLFVRLSFTFVAISDFCKIQFCEKSGARLC